MAIDLSLDMDHPFDPRERSYRLCLAPVLGSHTETKTRAVGMKTKMGKKTTKTTKTKKKKHNNKKKQVVRRRPSSAAVRVYRCELPHMPIRRQAPKRQSGGGCRRRRMRQQRQRPRTAGAKRALASTPIFDPDTIRIAPGDQTAQSCREMLHRLLREQRRAMVDFESSTALRLASKKTQKLINLEVRENKIALCIKMTKGEGSAVRSAAERVASPGKAGRLLDQWVDAEKDLCRELRRNARLNEHNHTKSREMLKRQQKKQITEALSAIKSRRQRQRELALVRLKEFHDTVEKAAKVRLLLGKKPVAGSVAGRDFSAAGGPWQGKNEKKKRKGLSELSQIRRESVRVYGRVRHQNGR